MRISTIAAVAVLMLSASGVRAQDAPGAAHLGFHVDLGDFSVVNTCLYQSTMVRGLTAAGLRQQTWQQPLVSPEGVAQFGEEYWKDFIEEPALIFLEAHR